MNQIYPILLLFVFAVLFGCETQEKPGELPTEPEPDDRIRYEAILDDTIQAYLSREQIPGLAVSVIRDGEIDWIKGYGYANVAAKTPVGKNTRFTVGDPAQVVIAVAFLQLQEKGKIALDDDINAYLPFQVVHPYFPQAKLTPRMLLAHSSGIQDRPAVLANYYAAGDPETSLGDFLRGYLTEGGADYSSLNFSPEKPGRKYDYSRVGISLAAYLVERIEGISFEQYCRVHVFAELGLFNTSWLLSGMQVQTLATPYEKIGASLQPQPFYSYPFYPAGTLRISIEHLSRFWLSMIESGVYGPQQLITPASLELMYPVQYPDASTAQAMAWTYQSLEGRTLLGLDGTDVGLSTRMKMDPQTRRGVILLSNGRGYDAALDRILLRVFEAAEIR